MAKIIKERVNKHEPANLQCDCGEIIALYDPLDNECECGACYNVFGQLVIPSWASKVEERMEDDY